MAEREAQVIVKAFLDEAKRTGRKKTTKVK
jgi:hypothetical protein